MESLDRTIFARSEEDLHKIYEDELQKLREKEFIFECVKKLKIEDFIENLPADSKKNIENALLTARIHDKIDMGNGLKLFGLNDLSTVKLTFAEQKIIREKVQDVIKAEIDNSVDTSKLEADVKKNYERIFELDAATRENLMTLEKLKQQQLELSMQVASLLVGKDQKLVVKDIEEETELLELKIKVYMETMEKNELEQAKLYREKFFDPISKRIDEMLKEKNKT